MEQRPSPQRTRAYQITFGDRYWDTGIDWSPDGQSLAFHRFWFAQGKRPGEQRTRPLWHAPPQEWGFAGIWSVGIRKREARRLLPSGVDPRYSPSGDALAYTRVVQAAQEGAPMQRKVAILSLRSGRQQLLRSRESLAPAWSPDGGRLCYLGLAAGGWEYFVCDASGENAHALPLPRPRPSRSELPSFFEPGVHDPAEIIVCPGPVLGGYYAPLAGGDYIPLRAAWSPDGRHITLPQTLDFYFSEADRTTYAWDRLWMVRADGREPRMLVEANVERYGYTRFWDLQWLRSGRAILLTRSTESADDNAPGWGIPPYRLEMDPPLSPSDRGYRPPADPAAAGTFIKGWRWGEQWLKPVPESAGAKIGTQWGVDEQGAPVPLTGEGADPVWSPDGTRIAFVRDGHVWVVDVPRGAGGK